MHLRPHAPYYLKSDTEPSRQSSYVLFGPSYEEFNQLKYVNKQLYSETAGLEFKYNEVDLMWRGIAGRRDPRRPNKQRGMHYITFVKGVLADVGIGAESQKHRLQLIWQHAKTREESH
jgi:hypothetical protein